MDSPHGREGFDSEAHDWVAREITQHEEAYARLGNLGTTAEEILIAHLSGPERERDADEIAGELSGFAELENSVPTPDWAPPLSPAAYRKIAGVVMAYHAALPFTSSERRWFFGTWSEADKQSSSAEASLTTFETHRATIVSLGQRQTVTGKSLLQQWTEWRLGTGAYESNGAYDLARVALKDMVRLTLPDAPYLP